MKNNIENISQISIYFKSTGIIEERVNEVALLQPLARNASFEKESKTLQQRQWTFYRHIPFTQRVFIRIQTFLFHKFHKWIPHERKTPEARFKTVLAILLVQEPLRDFFLGSEKKRIRFLSDIQHPAYEWGFFHFSIPPMSLSSPFELSAFLTLLPGQEKSLIEDYVQLNLQMATLPIETRNEILFAILNRTERPPLTSVLEITYGENLSSIELSTQYAKTKVDGVDTKTRRIIYSYEEDQATSSIRTQTNILPGAKGTMNQRITFDTTNPRNPELVGAYSGELLTRENVLEQLLFLLKKIQGFTDPVFLLEDSTIFSQKIEVLFLSLFSWNEWDELSTQHLAIASVDGHIVTSADKEAHRLRLLHYNIPFNVLNRYPAPGEIEAKMEDINEPTLAFLTFDALRLLGLPLSSSLCDCILALEEGRKEKNFFTHEKVYLEAIDAFRQLKKEIISQLNEEQFTARILKTLLLKKMDGKSLNGMDTYLCLRQLAKQLGLLCSTNCQNSTDRSAGANASDKAQNAFEKIMDTIYLPSHSSEEEQGLFKVLYSMYLVWEEPELTAGLSTGFMGEKFFNNFFLKNPETTRYLIRWLKKNPEFYLGLSEYRD